MSDWAAQDKFFATVHTTMSNSKSVFSQDTMQNLFECHAHLLSSFNTALASSSYDSHIPEALG